jgi:hypothetical protein
MQHLKRTPLHFCPSRRCAAVLFSVCLQLPKFANTPMGYLQLNASAATRTEMCLELVSLTPPASNPSAGLAVNFFNLRFTLTTPRGELAAGGTDVGSGTNAVTATSTRGSSSSSNGSTLYDDGVESASTLAAAAAGVPHGMPADAALALDSNPHVAEYEQLAPSPAMTEFEQRVRAAAQLSSSAIAATTAAATVDADVDVSGVSTQQQALWQQLQQRYKWPGGQVVFQSLYRPCNKVGACREDCDAGTEFVPAAASAGP